MLKCEVQLAGKLNAKLSCRTAEALLTGAQMLNPAQCSKVLRCCTNIATLHMPEPVSVRPLALKQCKDLGSPGPPDSASFKSGLRLLSCLRRCMSCRVHRLRCWPSCFSDLDLCSHVRSLGMK